MAKKKKNNLYAKIEHVSNSRFKKTTIGGKINRYKTSSLNKHKRRQLGI
tara:strand:- start:2616 stop:2762 length:147 start_codon:yes stop_codon:yes gene_type:complete